MLRPLLFSAILAGLLWALRFAPGAISAQQIDSIGTEHVRLRMPAERESLGRDLAAEIERCYVFMHRATGASLPRKILIQADWVEPESSCNWKNASITIGMNQPAAAADLKGFLLHASAKEMARLGLLYLSEGAQREDTEFLFEGMIEILAHEYARSTRCLDAAWVISRYLDDMKLLGVSTQRSWSRFSSGKRSLRNASPGVTLLTTYRELQGRDIPVKLFQALKKNSLAASLAATFKAPASEVESVWLKRVREQQPADEIIITPEQAPKLVQTNLFPGSVKPGTTLEMQLLFEDRNRNLLPDGVFIRDENTGRVLQAEAASEKGSEFLIFKLPVDSNCAPGEYIYRVTAIDEDGNLRRWTGKYKVQ